MNEPEIEIETLDVFQTVLLDALSSRESPEKIKEGLLRNKTIAPYHVYVEQFEIRMIAIAVELVAKWGRRRETAT